MHAFGGIERFENSLAHLFGHAHAGIGKPQSDAIVLSFATDIQRPAFRHRIDGVHNQVHKDFAHL